ncbi:glutathione S-transferase family protein [Rhizobium changzhiense]|nr:MULTISPECIES: glutathione S-transferase family protein [Rhizobium]MCH4549493.1 glutathione S-transferase family protein [Rhizobium changzhiense]
MSPDHAEARADGFHRLNPKGRIPVLIAENFTLTEAPAILFHLGLTNPGAGLLGAGAENIVRSIEWFNWLSSAVHAVEVRMIRRPALRMIWRADFFLPDQSMYAPLVHKGKEHLASAFALIESKLTDRDWESPI